jgi:hypothetical protein
MLLKALIEAGCWLTMCAVAAVVCYRIFVGLPPDGMVEEVARTGMIGIGVLTGISWIINIHGWMTEQRKDRQ